jgi:hypothetical protein
MRRRRAGRAARDLTPEALDEPTVADSQAALAKLSLYG